MPAPTRSTPAEKTTVELLQLRVWAADVRDDRALAEGPRSLAATLCRLLDLRGRAEAQNLRASLDETASTLVEQLAAAGLRP